MEQLLTEQDMIIEDNAELEEFLACATDEEVDAYLSKCGIALGQ